MAELPGGGGMSAERCMECGGDMDKPGELLGDDGEQFCHFKVEPKPCIGSESNPCVCHEWEKRCEVCTRGGCEE